MSDKKRITDNTEHFGYIHPKYFTLIKEGGIIDVKHKEYINSDMPNCIIRETTIITKLLDKKEIAIYYLSEEDLDKKLGELFDTKYKGYRILKNNI